jgi:hypothetical protein
MGALATREVAPRSGSRAPTTGTRPGRSTSESQRCQGGTICRVRLVVDSMVSMRTPPVNDLASGRTTDHRERDRAVRVGHSRPDIEITLEPGPEKRDFAPSP